MRGVRSSVLHFVVARLRVPCSFTQLRFRGCRSRTSTLWMCLLSCVCSRSNVALLRPAGVHGWLQVAAIETAVCETDIFASSACDFNIITMDHMRS